MTTSFFDFREQVTGRKSVPAPSRSGAVPPDALTVSQLTARIDNVLRNGFPQSLVVRGEISNFNHNRASGHCYFTLKEGSVACVDCVMYRSQAASLRFTPSDGLEMLAHGTLKVYAPRGRYQLVVNRLQPLGQGALELAFQQLKAKLEAEGLFAEERKKPIPRYPLRVALITSRDGAALQDMLKVMRRFPWLRLMLYHVPVQGDGCGAKIATAIDHLSAFHEQVGGVDVVLLGRGGGSLEDLWGFNEEAVARAVARSRLPVVTGVGHEVDVSIADLVADHHAHTPTEAAQVIT
ncbi:MAG: exodeoxyribonuclease VII large subunit, partial [Tepidisphaeraceae bacterium]